MPLTAMSFSNSIFSSSRKKSEQGNGVLANMGVHLQGHFLAGVRQRRVRRYRDCDIIANTVNIDDDLVRPFFEQRSSQAGNHTAIIISALEWGSWQGAGSSCPKCTNGHAEIAGDEARHLTQVLRVEAGQVFEISDNHELYLARDRDCPQVPGAFPDYGTSAGSSTGDSGTPVRRAVQVRSIGTAAGEGDRARCHVQFILCARSEAKRAWIRPPRSASNGGGRIVVEASQQSRRLPSARAVRPRPIPGSASGKRLPAAVSG